MDDGRSCVVLDMGSATVKAGPTDNFSAEPQPPSVVAPSAMHVHGDGEATMLKPVVRGEAVDMDGVEALIHACLYDYCGWAFESEGCVVICEPVMSPRAERERMTQLMFETFNVDGLYFQDQASLSLYAVNRTSGCVVDVGYNKVDISTVQDGQLFTSSSWRLPFGGHDLTRMLEDSVMAREKAPPTNAIDWEALKHACAHAAESPYAYERACLVARQGGSSASRTGAGASGAGASANAESNEETKPTGEPITYTLPDGQAVDITTEGLQLAEALFKPELVGERCMSVPECVLSSTSTIYEGNARRVGIENLLVCGGGGDIPGLGARLVHEVKALVPPGVKPGLVSVPEHMPKTTKLYAPWLGGAVVTKVLLKDNQFISKWDYQDEGPCAGHRKCL